MGSKILILMPVYNDWESLRQILDNLSSVLGSVAVSVLVVDDGSTQAYPEQELKAISNQVGGARSAALESLEVLELGRNVGHQRAIAIGLAHIAENRPCDAVVVMDADGEDEPSDVLRLIQAFEASKGERIIFAGRVKRSESILFKMFYAVYKVLYRLLTGSKISVGNFSIVPWNSLRRLVLVSEIWNHYAAGVLKAKLPYAILETKRGLRLQGKSKMNFTGLVTHGLSSISVHSDTIGARALIVSGGLSVLAILGILAVIAVRLGTELAIPGWASTLVSSLFVILFQSIISSLIFAFMVLSGRNFANFIPKKDYKNFTLETHKVF